MEIEESGLKFEFSDGSTAVKFDDTKYFISEYLTNNNKEKYVILFLEGKFEGYTRSKKAIMKRLQDSMNAKLKWLNCKVSVVDTDTYSPKIFNSVR